MKSFKGVLGWASVFAVAIVVQSANAQQSDEELLGGFDLELPEHRALFQRYAHRADVRHDEVLQPIFKAERASHVASGIALRNRAGGVIHSRGIPSKSKVVSSFLFWNFSDGNDVGERVAPVLFEGNLVRGQKTADNTDPCWGMKGNHSYVADVTPFTNQTGGSNQEYDVTLPFSLTTVTGGQSPWPAESHDTRLQGASLVVIYQNESTVGPLFVFAPPGDNMFVASTTYLFASPALGEGLFSMLGSDGQRGFGHDNSLSNETTFFDGNQIAGPPVAASDWDGADGLTLPQLWDTHTHEVRIGNAVSRVDYIGSSDCLVPVGFVLDQE